MSFRIACLLVFLGLSTSVFARDMTKSEVSGGLSYLRSNEADGICGWFNLIGASGTFVLNANRRFSGVADVGYLRSSNINSTGFSLGLLTYMAGPRISFRGQKLTVFGQVLAGGVKSHSNFVYNNANSFAGSAGAGVDIRITPRFSWRMLQADYLLTRVPNGSTPFRTICGSRQESSSAWAQCPRKAPTAHTTGPTKHSVGAQHVAPQPGNQS